MASTVINDPEALHAYREEIFQRIEDLKRQLKSTEGAIETCNQEGWKDGKFMEFQNKFDQEKVEIQNLCNGLQNYYDNILAQLEQKLRGYTDEALVSSSF